LGTGLEVVRQVVWVVGSAPGEGTTVRVVTETVCPGLGYRTRVIVFGTIVVVVLEVWAGALEVGVDAGVTGMESDVVVVSVATDDGLGASAGRRARRPRLRCTNGGAGVRTCPLLSADCTPMAARAADVEDVSVNAAGAVLEDCLEALDEQAVTIAAVTPRQAATAYTDAIPSVRPPASCWSWLAVDLTRRSVTATRVLRRRGRPQRRRVASFGR
jgi:hypothetical protein